MKKIINKIKKWFIKKELDTSVIPYGDYCYSNIRHIGNGHLKVDVCPYWSIREDKPNQMNGYCVYLKKGDWESGCGSLLWDQVKECGVNNYD